MKSTLYLIAGLLTLAADANLLPLNKGPINLPNSAQSPAVASKLPATRSILTSANGTKLLGSKGEGYRDFVKRGLMSTEMKHFMRVENRTSTNCIGNQRWPSGPCYRMAAGSKYLPFKDKQVYNVPLESAGIHSQRMAHNHMYLAFQSDTDFDGANKANFDGSYLELYSQPKCELTYPDVVPLAGILIGPSSIKVEHTLATKQSREWLNKFNLHLAGEGKVPGVGKVGFTFSASQQKSYFDSSIKNAEYKFNVLPHQTCVPSQLKAGLLCTGIKGFGYFYEAGLPLIYKEFDYKEILIPAYDGADGFFKQINGCIDYLAD